MMPPNKRIKYYFVGLILLLLLLFIADIFIGSVEIPPGEIFKIIFGKEASKASWSFLITEFRIPKAITALLAGSSLAVCGLLMQTFFRNPLAGPFVLGISSGASLGVALVILTAGSFGFGALQFENIAGKAATTIAAGIGACITLFFITIVARKISSNVTLLILGLMFGHLVGAVEGVLKFFSTAENLQGYVIWGMGNLSGVTWNDLSIIIPVIFIGLVLSFIFSKQLNLLLLGDQYARSMGVNIDSARIIIVILCGIFAGIITAFCGPIAFIGIAVPHLTKMLLNETDHKILIPSAAVIGASLTILCDIISQLPGNDQTLPINAVTSIIGAPIVIWIIMRQKHLKLNANE